MGLVFANWVLSVAQKAAKATKKSSSIIFEVLQFEDFTEQPTARSAQKPASLKTQDL